MGWDSYRLLQDATVRALLPKINCEFDPEIEAEFPANMSGKVTIAARGQRFVRKVVVPKGEPTNFLTEAELRAKFAGLAEAVLGAERTAPLAAEVLAIDHLGDVGVWRGGAADGGAAGGRMNGALRPRALRSLPLSSQPVWRVDRQVARRRRGLAIHWNTDTRARAARCSVDSRVISRRWSVQFSTDQTPSQPSGWATSSSSSRTIGGSAAHQTDLLHRLQVGRRVPRGTR